MIYAITIFPKIKQKSIQKIRRKYDPGCANIKPHVTVVYPIPSSESKKEILLQIKKSVSGIGKFEMRLRGVCASPTEYYLYLIVGKGKSVINKIHKRFYKSKYKKYLKKIPVIPHLTLGVFESRAEINRAIKEIRQNHELDFECVVDRLNLLTVRDNKLKNVVEIMLKK
ncbi:2'-5' RNA ligase family protein [Candidatus Woesearchaeota archaeon]|jgi:2'-5' RNA ligase|nr:2'-5' RNA ligase family protein [Candidatus Woesearchaeota archaeon]MBT6519913.1 2'-5' RNA ligase family protein [Candidatus Woesearchaeota archaeon]MBT7367111.1 2'-5' RNA ligase family protein [Candidatus Woesearchaeota archaeon]